MPAFLRAKSLKPFIDKDLATATEPIEFVQPRGGRAHGYKAETLPKVCEVYLRARDAGALASNQMHMAKAAEIIMRGLAHVGIIALVDEVTGFQEARAKDALEKILERFVAKELRKWVSTFPIEFYREMFRLRDWNLNTDYRSRPGVVGTYTNDIVYERLAPGVLEELKRLTPRGKTGKRTHRYHQRLTEEHGHPKLREHLAAVVALMRISDDWDDFMYKLDRAFPKPDDNMMLPIDTRLQES